MITDELLAKANQGDADAQFKLAREYDTEGEKHAEWIRKAAENGHAKAQWRWGDLLQWGDCGVTKDIDEAVKWYRKSADKGYKRAQFSLAECYFRGHITGVSPGEAFELALDWMKKAATTDEGGEGLNEAQYCLAIYYANGATQTGEGKDDKKSDGWFAIAANNGNATAQSKIGNDYFIIWLAERAEWEKNINNASIYGVPKVIPKDNLDMAYDFVKKAVDSGKIVTPEKTDLAKKRLRDIEEELKKYDELVQKTKEKEEEIERRKRESEIAAKEKEKKEERLADLRKAEEEKKKRTRFRLDIAFWGFALIYIAIHVIGIGIITHGYKGASNVDIFLCVLLFIANLIPMTVVYYTKSVKFFIAGIVLSLLILIGNQTSVLIAWGIGILLSCIFAFIMAKVKEKAEPYPQPTPPSSANDVLSKLRAEGKCCNNCGDRSDCEYSQPYSLCRHWRG